MSEANWFHVFNSTKSRWLQDDECSWGPYIGAAEFSDMQLALSAGVRAKGTSDDTVIVLADHGQVDEHQPA